MVSTSSHSRSRPWEARTPAHGSTEIWVRVWPFGAASQQLLDVGADGLVGRRGPLVERLEGRERRRSSRNPPLSGPSVAVPRKADGVRRPSRGTEAVRCTSVDTAAPSPRQVDKLDGDMPIEVRSPGRTLQRCQAGQDPDRLQVAECLINQCIAVRLSQWCVPYQQSVVKRSEYGVDEYFGIEVGGQLAADWLV